MRPDAAMGDGKPEFAERFCDAIKSDIQWRGLHAVPPTEELLTRYHSAQAVLVDPDPRYLASNGRSLNREMVREWLTADTRFTPAQRGEIESFLDEGGRAVYVLETRPPVVAFETEIGFRKCRRLLVYGFAEDGSAIAYSGLNRLEFSVSMLPPPMTVNIGPEGDAVCAPASFHFLRVKDEPALLLRHDPQGITAISIFRMNEPKNSSIWCRFRVEYLPEFETKKLRCDLTTCLFLEGQINRTIRKLFVERQPIGRARNKKERELALEALTALEDYYRDLADKGQAPERMRCGQKRESGKEVERCWLANAAIVDLEGAGSKEVLLAATEMDGTIVQGKPNPNLRRRHFIYVSDRSDTPNGAAESRLVEFQTLSPLSQEWAPWTRIQSTVIVPLKRWPNSLLVEIGTLWAGERQFPGFGARVLSFDGEKVSVQALFRITRSNGRVSSVSSGYTPAP